MFKLGNLFNRQKNNTNSGINSEQNPILSNVSDQTISSNTINKVSNWYEERYENTIVQRNLLFVVLVILLCLSIVSVSVVIYVINTKRFDPFVIQIDDTTGTAKVVNPISSSILSGNEALARYFIKKYVTARETYNPVDFDTVAKKNVQLLSSNSVYWSYRGYLKNPEVDPTIKYGQKNTTYLTVKSWSKLEEKKYILRFSVHETDGNLLTFNKIAVIEFDYIPMELTEDDKDVNPVGFQVTGYRVDDDNS